MTDDLSNALWHVGEIFTEIDDRIDYWNGLMNYMINYHAPTRRKRCPVHDRRLEKSHQKEETICENKTNENVKLKKKYINLATKEHR